MVHIRSRIGLQSSVTSIRDFTASVPLKFRSIAKSETSFQRFHPLSDAARNAIEHYRDAKKLHMSLFMRSSRAVADLRRWTQMNAGVHLSGRSEFVWFQIRCRQPYLMEAWPRILHMGVRSNLMN